MSYNPNYHSPITPIVNKEAHDENVKIVQFADDERTLPDGSKIIYAESDQKIILYHKKNMEAGIIYTFNRETGDILVNNKKGSVEDKKSMLELGKYFISNSNESEMVTISVKKTS
ncbi:hypothetical protein DID77_00520 [Candidatus Marinamargulisbacteria bacterium SCGC AG-439-L15]|nr:hypothetical protein DID77_00520 [Candidatus Marinamargulisbacteria bacterium SCGC AG-439-L15]